ncbi:MAG: iron-containing alcohol dehydrogenase [Candidatus Sulfobium sp.]
MKSGNYAPTATEASHGSRRTGIRILYSHRHPDGRRCAQADRRPRQGAGLQETAHCHRQGHRKSRDSDSIISLGGGSSHDCGKAVGVLAANGGKIQDYEGIDKSTKAMPPFIAINTTAGTASEMTRFCIITDTKRKIKMAIVDWRVTPNVAINDPLLMAGMPPALTAATGMDALTHAVEAYVSTIATPVTDACALRPKNLKRA